MGLRTTTDQRYFVYDGDQMVLVMDPTGAVQNRYLWGAAVDEILADEEVGGELLWTLTDNLGTVRELVNNTSTVRNHIVYDTYGNVLSETAGGARSSIKFTGRYLDTETGLQWNLNRWYDAKTGRWLSQDPIGFEGGDANLYRYVGNDPGNGVDPSGLAAEEKSASQASERAKELERILGYRLDMLKQIAKETKEVERFGVILKAKDPNATPSYKFYECTSKKSWEKVKGAFGEDELYGLTRSPFRWWGSKKMHGALAPKPGADGKIDLDATKGVLDRDYPIEFDWHTHPPIGDAWPSTGDGEMCRDNDMVGVMIRYIGRMRGGKIEDGWAIWIIDIDGKTYEYKPPITPKR